MASSPPTPDPIVGIILRRDGHPAAPSLSVLADPLTGPEYAADEHLPLSEALARPWVADAHLMLYVLRDEADTAVYARVSKHSGLRAELVGIGGRIELPVLALDYDLPEHREWATPEEAAGWVAQVLDSATAPEPTYVYTTLHGGRMVYVLDRPIEPGPAESATRYLIARWAASGLALDRKVADWTRLFRLPRAVREDSGRSFAADERFLESADGPLLVTADLPAYRPGEDDVHGIVEEYQGDRPDADACLALVADKGFVADAKRALRGRESFAVAFEHACFSEAALADGWDNCVLFHVGQVVSMMADYESSSPEHCYALLRPALEQLTITDQQGGRDWEVIGWDKVRRMWAQERAKMVAAREREVAAASEGREVRERLVAEARAAAPEEVPLDPSEARDWLERRMIVSDGRRHYVMRRDGSYNLAAVGDSMLIPMIRELEMSDVIAVRREGKYIRAAEVLAAHSVPVQAVRCSVSETHSRIDGASGERVLRVPIHRLNRMLKPARSEEVDEWLRALFGSRYAIGVEWLSHALDVSAPICALNLHGEPGSGKSMLAQGLAECFEGESPNDGRALDRFNIGLLRSPVIWCDEGIPRMRGLGTTTDQVFRSLVSGGPLQIEGKMRDVIVADMNPRIVITSNDKDILRELVGERDLTDDDVRSIEQRLLTIQVGSAARRLLASRGNRRYTKGWIAGEVPSSYVFANHLMHLFISRRPSRSSTERFLVEGETRTELVRDMRLTTHAAQAVLRAVARMLEQSSPRVGLHIADGRAWVTVSGVTDYLDTQIIGGGRGVSMPQVSRVLRQFAAEHVPESGVVPLTYPPGCARGRWIELDLAAILEECLRYGMGCERIEGLLAQRPSGPGEVAEARAAARPALGEVPG